MVQPFVSNNPDPGKTPIPVPTVDSGILSAEGGFLDDTASIKDNVGFYPHTSMKNRYQKLGNVHMMGITSPNGFQGASVAFAKISTPTLLWISEWSILSLDRQPNIPNPVLNHPEWVLLGDEQYEPVMVKTTGDNLTPIYRISGVYTYGQRNPKSQTVNDISYPRPPWLEDVFARDQPVSTLEQGLTLSQSSQSAGGNVAFAP